MSENPTPVYDSRCKKYRSTRRRIFKDHDGKYKEKLEIKNCEKRTLFGSPPFEANSNWKLDDLCDIEYNDPKTSRTEKNQQNTVSKLSGKDFIYATTPNDLYQKNANIHKKSRDDSSIDPETSYDQFQSTLRRIFSKLKNGNQNKALGLKTIFEKKRGNNPPEFSNDENSSSY